VKYRTLERQDGANVGQVFLWTYAIRTTFTTRRQVLILIWTRPASSRLYGDIILRKGGQITL